MNLEVAYQDLQHLLTYVALYAPELPAPDALPAEDALKQLFSLFSNLRIREKHQGALEWLKSCHEQMRAGRDSFLQGDFRAWRDRMLEAKRYLDYAQGQKSK